MTLKEKEYLTPAEVGQILMISPVTVRQWAQKGDLKAMTTPGGHRRFSRADVDKFINAKGSDTGTGKGEALRVLIVDDDIQTSRYLVELIAGKDESIETAFAKDGFEAGLMVYQFLPHIILLDLMMPNVDGYKVCEGLKTGHMTRTMRVIAMTGFYSPENVKRIIEAGAEICLQKPFSPEILFKAMRLEKDD